MTIGDHCNFGPNVTIVTPMHPMLPDERRGWCATMGWSGFVLCQARDHRTRLLVRGKCGGLPRRGHRGELRHRAGSVVTRDIPAGSFAAGNPARVIRPITAADTVRGRFPGIRGKRRADQRVQALRLFGLKNLPEQGVVLLQGNNG